DGADGGVEAALDESDDVAERLMRVVAVRDELADLLQGQEQGALVSGAGRAHVRCCLGPRALDYDRDGVPAKGLSARREGAVAGVVVDNAGEKRPARGARAGASGRARRAAQCGNFCSSSRMRAMRPCKDSCKERRFTRAVSNLPTHSSSSPRER